MSSAPREIGETVREAVHDGWGATARLAVLLLVGAIAAAVFCYVYLSINGSERTPAPSPTGISSGRQINR